MVGHIDTLEKLNENVPLKEKLVSAHKSVRKNLPFISRIAIALYDPVTTIVKTFVHSSGDKNPLDNYQLHLDDAPSLKRILEQGYPRVINNMLTFDASAKEHVKRLGRAGYAANYTMPFFNDGNFLGFIFFNSSVADVFDDKVLAQMDIFGHMIALMVVKELSTIKTLSAALKVAGKITHLRDPETGSHLDRMSRYSRLIAGALAKTHRLDDSYIEHIFMFSPLHDIGKIGIPDEILMKAGSLNESEMEIMKTHPVKGREIIDAIINNFGLEGVDYVEILRNIAEFHHEAVDGSGYPSGKRGNDIPLEARIVAVADIFDALTSRRVYKDVWTNKKACAMLKRLSGESLDEECVDALIDNLGEVEKIQQLFKEDYYGYGV